MRRRLIGIKPRSKDTHVAIAINNDRTLVILKVDSNSLKGRGTTIKVRLKDLGDERSIKNHLMFAAAQLAERQNILWKDEHDIREVAMKTAEAWNMMMKDHLLLAEIGTLVPFSPHSPDNDPAQAARVSRASEDDPLTRDILKGKGSKWGLQD